MIDRLDVYLYESLAATLAYLGPSQYRLDYLPEWVDGDLAVPLSLSLPLTSRRHEGRIVLDFIDNLLPDNIAVRDRWAQDAGLSNTEPFWLLRAYGADVAGAVEFHPHGAHRRTDGILREVSESDVARRIRLIRDDDTLWNDPETELGRFSLGGAQAKFALAFADGQWHDPDGSHPTTHIFKPRVTSQIDGELVEYVTMSAAGALGLLVPAVRLHTFDDEHSLVVERFDRIRTDGSWVRIHQEDFCQALGVPRLRKYEQYGGPSYRIILDLLSRLPRRADVRDAKELFVKALIFSWLMLNTDAHAKNYSLRILPGQVAATPLYDISSLLPYIRPDESDARALSREFHGTVLSMRIADSYAAGSMTGFEWRAVTRDADLDADTILEWTEALALAMPAVVGVIASGMDARFQTPVIERLVDRVAIRSQQVLGVLSE